MTWSSGFPLLIFRPCLEILTPKVWFCPAFAHGCEAREQDDHQSTDHRDVLIASTVCRSFLLPPRYSLVVMASASGAEDPGFESRLRWDFSGSSHTSDLKIGTPVTTCQAPGIIGSALGLVGPVSVYCDWVR